MADIIKKSEIGQRIRQLRLLNNYTQAEFAELIDVSVNFLSEIENGKRDYHRIRSPGFANS